MLKDDMMKTRFKKPIKLEGSSAVVLHIIRLLLLTPGENQSHPEMGVGLVSKHRYSFEEDLKDLEEIIREQIQTYLPMLKDVNVNLNFKDNILYISFDVTGMTISMDLKNNHLALRDVTRQ